MEYWSENPLLYYSITPSLQCPSGFLHVAHKRFSLVYRNVRIGYEGRQLVDHIAFGKSFVAPVPGHADLVDDFAVDSEGAQPPRDQSLSADLCPRAGDFAPVEILDAFFLGQLGTDLDEQLGLQLGEPWEPAAHPARQVMLGQSVRGQHIRELWIAELRQLVAGILPVFEDRARLLFVKRI